MNKRLAQVVVNDMNKKAEDMKVKTMEDWKYDFTKDFQPGDFVESTIVNKLSNDLMPVYDSEDIIQCGGAVGSIVKDNRLLSTFTTFKRINNDVWKYLGDFPKIKNLEEELEFIKNFK